jgi:hypothetical protein
VHTPCQYGGRQEEGGNQAASALLCKISRQHIAWSGPPHDSDRKQDAVTVCDRSLMKRRVHSARMGQGVWWMVAEKL